MVSLKILSLARPDPDESTVIEVELLAQVAVHKGIVLLSDPPALHTLAMLDLRERREVIVMKGIRPYDVYLTLQVVSRLILEKIRLKVYIFLR
jgi:hypothetical protein